MRTPPLPFPIPWSNLKKKKKNNSTYRPLDGSLGRRSEGSKRERCVQGEGTARSRLTRTAPTPAYIGEGGVARPDYSMPEGGTRVPTRER